MNEFRFEVAELCISIRSSNKGLLTQFEERFQYYSSSKMPRMSVRVEVRDGNEFLKPEFFELFSGANAKLFNWYYTGGVNLEKKEAHLIISDQNSLQVLEQFILWLFSLLCIHCQQLLFHSAVLVDDDHAYVFFGPSGAGKSTAAKNSTQLKLISDDLVVLRQQENRFRIFKTPFPNDKSAHDDQRLYAIKGFYRLIKDNCVYVEALQKSVAISEIISNVICMEKGNMECLNLFRLVSDMVEVAPILRLHLLPDGSFWNVITRN